MTSPRPTLADVSPLRLARAWRDVEPDRQHCETISAALAEGQAWIGELFDTPLHFGTAGIRGPLGPGSGAMNRVLVRVVAAGLAAFVHAQKGSKVVIGYDARRQSDIFASDIARVLAAHRVQAILIDRPTPTPVLAFAVRHLDADAGVMVTASHNPREDNGCKIYGSDGALLSSPVDASLAELIMSTSLVSDNELARLSDVRIHHVGDDLVDAYVDAACSLLQPESSRELSIAYTPLHGVGFDVLNRAFEQAGFPEIVVVPEQLEPDAEFPTTPFPNPEEPGVLDLLFESATGAESQLALANDPDADRLAVAIPDTSSASGWRLLTGDDVGCLLADRLLSHEHNPSRVVVNTVVSSRLLAQIAAKHGVESVQTLTGFKWILAAAHERDDLEFVLGYEEALGYCIGDVVHDKDGITAALLIAEYAAELKSDGRSLADALDDLHRNHGVHVGGQRSLRVELAGPTGADVMAELRARPAQQVAGETVQIFDDLLTSDSFPPTDAVLFHLDGARLTVRPSGTEPKVKIYGEVWCPVSGAGDIEADRDRARRRLTTLITGLTSDIADPERQRFAGGLAAATTETDERADETTKRAADLFARPPGHLNRAQALDLVIRSIDLTTLAGDDTPGRIRALCAQARRPDPADPTVGPVAAVCVYPNLISTVAELTRGSGIAVASVASAFPSGQSSLDVRLRDIEDAIEAGADEVDVVLNRCAFLMGEHDLVTKELAAMRDCIGDRVMKVILETSEIADPAAIRIATQLAIHAGADWVKTSTGKTSQGATPEAVLAISEAVASHVEAQGEPVGIKVSGGVRTPADALGYLAIIEATVGSSWLHPDRVRFGASGLLNAVVGELRS